MTDGTTFNLGFIGVYESAGADGLTGAAMVTNERGYPLEFRATTTVRPSAVQKALYGESLERYVTAELIVRRLCSEMQIRPVICFANRQLALDAEPDIPLVFISASETLVLREGTRAIQRLANPLGHGRELTLLGEHEDVERATEYLSHSMKFFEPVETFDRMGTALRVLAESDARYR